MRFLDVDCEKYRNQMKHQISSLALAQMEILLIFEQAKHRPFFEISLLADGFPNEKGICRTKDDLCIVLNHSANTMYSQNTL